MEKNCKYLDLLIQKGLLGNLLEHLYPVEESTVDFALKKLDFSDGGRYVVTAIFSAKQSSDCEERIFSLTDENAYSYTKDDNLKDCSDILQNFMSNQDFGNEYCVEVLGSFPSDKTGPSFLFNLYTQDFETFKDLISYLCQDETALITSVAHNFHEGQDTLSVVVKSFMGEKTLDVTDFSAIYNGSIDRTNLLKKFMFCQKNGIEYAAALHERALDAANREYLEAVKIHDKYHPRAYK